MKETGWAAVLAASADAVRAAKCLARLRDAGAGDALERAGREPARVLATLLGGSQALGECLVAHPGWLPPLLDVEGLRFPRIDQGLRHEVEAWLRPALAARDFAGAFAKLREFKQRENLRIATRDLARLGALTEILRELSDVADVCLDAVARLCRRQLADRFGEPWHRDADGDWQPTAFCVLGMGKLGGRELNYSSDVDVLFVYEEEGFAFKEPPGGRHPGGQGLTSGAYFQRLAEAVIAEVGRLAPEGRLYRIDLRLRPEGKAGPLARPLAGYETYYAQWGQTWERMMLIKARGVAGDATLAGEFLEMVQPFRYPRSLSEQVLRDIADMKRRTENEVVRAGELERNVKLGRGGIREIEFIVQTLQIIHAGKVPFLADPQTLAGLDKLVRYKILPAEDAGVLTAAYVFMREVEHRLQMENNLQTHTIPEAMEPRRRLARLMGCATVKAFDTRCAAHRRAVRGLYDQLLQRKEAGVADALPDLATGEAAWKALLAARSFREPDKALRLVRAFVLGPGFGHTSARTGEFARQMLGRLLALCPLRDDPAAAEAPPFPDGDPRSRRLSDPDRILARLDTFIAAYGARALLFETWASNPSLFDLLVLLFDRSEFLAETAIRTPDLVDDLELSGHLARSKTAAQTLKDLEFGRGDADQRLWLRRYHQTEFMRIGLRDILGLADFEQNLVELSALADACLQYALEVALRRRRLKTAPVAIIGLGKLGGAELNYGSDLDIVFVARDGVRNLPALQRVAVEVKDLLGSRTELGVAFEVDVRLRPDGEKGLLVNTLGAYADYYRRRAWLWEAQAISRSRFIAGNAALGAEFEKLVADLADFSRPATAAAPARDQNWRAEIAKMRRRIEKERTPAGQDTLAIKTGVGGLMDAEFIAQTLCLAHGWHEPNTLRALQLARERGALPASDADPLIENYRRLRRVEGILRRWSYEGETELPVDPAPLYRVAVRCGFTNAGDFLKAAARYRAAIRSVYQTVFVGTD
jgi:glutamate-ammonia-ligase adenylyltransferase